MGFDHAELVAGELHRPRPVEDGAVTRIDLGIPGTVILEVETTEEVYYETYELVKVEAARDVL